MQLHIIKTWLLGRKDYQEGLSLYNQLGDNPTLKRIFSFGENSYNRRKMEQELRALVDQVEAAGENEGQDLVEGRLFEDDPVLAGLKKEMKPLFQESSRLHRELSVSYSVDAISGKIDQQDMETRRKTAFRILQIHEEILPEIYARLDHYRETGKLTEIIPDPEPEYETDPVKMMKRLNNLRTYISKFKDDERKAADVEKWRKEIHYYDKKLAVHA